MDLWESIKKWFRSEAADARDLTADVERDLSVDLDRREAELRATPEQRMEQLQERIADNDDAFDDIRSGIESAGDGPDKHDPPSP